MIKINLLESITDRPTGAAMVEARVTSPRIQTVLLALTVLGLFVVTTSYDYVSSKSDQAVARQEVENQRRINQQMLAVNNEQADLEKKAQDIQGRIDAIKKLSGMFTNFNIETQRETVQDKGASAQPDSPVAPIEVVSFTLKCSYGAKAQAQPTANSATNQVALKK